MKILILIDYRSHFYSSTRHRGASLELADLRNGFEQIGYSIDIRHFVEVDLRHNNYRNVFVLYQSAEDPSLLYRDYIEDVLLGLSLQGAILIPSFPLFRAHHNKVFMELLRDSQMSEELSTVQAQTFGTYEEYKQLAKLDSFPVVFKTSGDSKSHQVLMARTREEADRMARKLSRTPSFFNFLLSIRNCFDGKGFTPVSNHRHKFVVQKFIPNLTGDYKIVVYGEKYFVLFRENRPHDFRASGSGRLSFPRIVPVAILDYAKHIFKSFDVPFISIDVGYDGKTCYLFEFQFVMFGQYAVEQSAWHFIQENEQWNLVEGRTTAEAELITAIHNYIQVHNPGGAP